MKCIQYTLRNVSQQLDAKLRAEAVQSGRSLNQVILDTLSQAIAPGDSAMIHKDLDGFCGTWVEDPEFDRAVEAFEAIDPEKWR